MNRRSAGPVAIGGDVVGYGADPVAEIDRERAIKKHRTPVLMDNRESGSAIRAEA